MGLGEHKASKAAKSTKEKVGAAAPKETEKVLTTDRVLDNLEYLRSRAFRSLKGGQ